VSKKRPRDVLSPGRTPVSSCPVDASPSRWGVWAWWVRVDVRERTQITGATWILGGILKQDGYSLELSLQRKPNAAIERRIAAFFTNGIHYAGETWNPRWSQHEIESRWTQVAPPDLGKK